jgi:hypothetical protein
LLIAQLSIQHVLTYLLQVSLSQPQVDCIASYLRALASAQRRNRFMLFAAAAAGVFVGLSALIRLNRRH